MNVVHKALLLVVFGLGLSGPARADLSETRDLLGGLSGVLAAVDFTEGQRVYTVDLTSGRRRPVPSDLDCEYPEISGDGSLLVYGRGKELVVRSLAGMRSLVSFSGYHGRWWTAPDGERWIYFSSAYADTIWPSLSRDVTTWRRRLSDGHAEQILDWKTTAGPSPDGTHLGSDYISVLLFDLASSETHVLNRNKRGCYASMAPDNTYRVLHLGLGHNRLLVHDPQDRLVWWAAMPEGTTYINQPRWTNHPDYAVFTSREEDSSSFSVFLVRLSAVDPRTGRARPGQRAVTRVLDARTGSHTWAHPFLWLTTTTPHPAPHHLTASDMVLAADEGGCAMGRAPRRGALTLVMGLALFMSLALCVVLGRR